MSREPATPRSHSTRRGAWASAAAAMALAATAAGPAPASGAEPGGSIVAIPAGAFTMGTNARGSDTDERPAHRVFLDAFRIDRIEVTVASYKKCIAAGVCAKITSGDPGLTDEEWFASFRDAQPIREVSWSDADRYCRWIGKRLPTEAEWEKAARGPRETVNPWGDGPFQKGAAAVGGPKLFDVGSFARDDSGYGIADMAGNVSEWVADWYAKDFYGRSPDRNPSGPPQGTRKVVRGGNFTTNVKGDRRSSFFATTRYGLEPDEVSDFIGFRCAASEGPSEAPTRTR